MPELSSNRRTFAKTAAAWVINGARCSRLRIRGSVACASASARHSHERTPKECYFAPRTMVSIISCIFLNALALGSANLPDDSASSSNEVTWASIVLLIGFLK